MPVTDGPRTRRATYRVAAPLGFSLGVLDRFRSEIDRGLGDAVLPSLLASLDDHLGAPWGEAVRDHLRLLAERLRRRAAAILGVDDPDDLTVVVAARERLTHLPPDVRGLTAHDVYG